jgi:hypothetical protein
MMRNQPQTGCRRSRQTFLVPEWPTSAPAAGKLAKTSCWATRVSAVEMRQFDAAFNARREVQPGPII